jgi:hypothetical protein
MDFDDWEQLNSDEKLEWLRLEVLGISNGLATMRVSATKIAERVETVETELKTVLRWLAKLDDRTGGPDF